MGSRQTTSSDQALTRARELTDALREHGVMSPAGIVGPYDVTLRLSIAEARRLTAILNSKDTP